MTHLNEREKIAFDIVKHGIEYAYQTDEITAMVAVKLKCSLSTAKGYIGMLVKKELIERTKYQDKQIGWITQFSLKYSI